MAQRQYYVNKYGVSHNYGFFGNKANCNLTASTDSFTTHATFAGGSVFSNLLYLEGARGITFSSIIHKDSLSFFRYSVTADDTVKLVTDAIPSQVEHVYNNYSDFPGRVMVNLGKFDITGRALKVEIYNVLKKEERYSAVLYNKPLAPAQIIGVAVYRMDTMMGTAFPRKISDRSVVNIDNNTTGFGLIIAARNTPFRSLYYVYLKHIPSGTVVPFFNSWSELGDTMVLSVAGNYIKDKGEYEISIVAASNENLALTPLKVEEAVFHFTAETDTATFSYKELTIVINCAIGGTMLFFFSLKRRQRLKLARERQQKELAQMKLSAVRQQLNPHFMFNALAGIQNLMNKQEIDNANRYLGKFARITRHVLENKELNSLAEEKSLLDDYLQMEQLRFGFQYTVDISVQLDAANIEIPSMLLQPFVENAVIHGVAGLQDKGWITVRFIKNEKDLQIVIKDNGSGFDAQQLYKGLGVSLSKNRISLLNKVYGQATVLLDMVSSEQGSTITITLKQWL